MGPLSDVLDPHRTWGLWIQLPLVLAVIAVSARAIVAAMKAGGVDGRCVIAALVPVLLLFAWLPWSDGSWSGHQGHYLELLQGREAEVGSLERTLTFPVPAGLAWAIGSVLPESIGAGLWRLANRGALAVVLLALAGVAGLLAGRSSRAPLLAIGLGAVSVPLLAWSTTGFALVPALAAAAVGMLLGAHGRPGLAVAWIGLALATRMECAVFLPLVALWSRERPSTGGALLAGVVLAVEGLLLAAKDSGLPGAPALDVLVENLGNIPLGGPWFAWGALGLWLAVVGIARPLDRWGAALGSAVLALSFVQIGTVLDLGARHLLPPTLLLVPLAALAVARAFEPGPARGLRAVAVALLVVVGGGAVQELSVARHQLIAEEPGVLPVWVAQADAGPTGELGELLDPACFVAVPEGERTWPGAADSVDVGIVHEARFQLDQGRCVMWAVQPGTRFAGDTQLEFLDRTVRTLRLEPEGWITRPDGRRWMLMRGR